MHSKTIFQKAIEKIETRKDFSRESSSIFEFEPVLLEEFIRGKRFLGLPKLSPKQYEAIDYATQIYNTDTLKSLGWKRLRYVNELVLLWGKGSGKDFVARVMLMRIAYLLLALKNPQAYFYSPDMSCGSESIHMLNTASTKDQAANVFFSPLRRYVKNSPFFKDRAEVLTSEIRFEKAITLISGHSEAEAQEGLNLIIVVLDEIAAFKTDEEVADLKRTRLRKNIPMSANSLHDLAMTSIMRFPKVGKVVSLSFPRFKGDFITSRYDEGKNDSKIYTSFGATFDINPTKKASDFAHEKKRNPIRYACRILCEPKVAEDAFFKNHVAIKRAFNRDLPNPIDMDTGRYKSGFRCADSFLRFGHVDLAKNRCRAAFCFVHAYDVKQERIETEDKKGEKQIVTVDMPLLKLDVLAYFQAPPGGEVNFAEIQSMLVEFVEQRGFYVALLTFDGYQSLQMMQAMEAKGLEVDIQSVDRTREAYETLQDAIYEERFTSYYNKILVEEELPFLIDWKGTRIEHRTGRGKDGSDAVAGAVNNCVKEEGWGSIEFWSEKPAQQGQMPKGFEAFKVEEVKF
jgi:hypothetical protein